jgi:transposase-like protein
MTIEDSIASSLTHQFSECPACGKPGKLLNVREVEPGFFVSRWRCPYCQRAYLTSREVSIAKES